MKNIILLAACFVIFKVPIIHGQSSKVLVTKNTVSNTAISLKQLTENVNQLLDKYNSVDSREEYQNISNYNIPIAEKKALLEKTDSKVKVTTEKLLAYFNAKILVGMKSILARSDLKEHDLKRLLQMEVCISPDNRFFCWYYDENSTGSAQSKISFLHYRRLDGKVYNYYPSEEHKV